MAYDADTKTRALELYAEGVEYDMISAELGPGRRAVRAWAAAAGLKPRSSGPPSIYDADAKALTVSLYEQGHSMLEISARTGASKDAIKTWVKQAGVKLRKSGSTPEVPTSELKRLYRKLRSQRAVAEVVGLCNSSVSVRLKGWKP